MGLTTRDLRRHGACRLVRAEPGKVMNIHVCFHDPEGERKLNKLLHYTKEILDEVKTMSAIVDALVLKVQNLESLDDSIITLLQTIAQEIADNVGDPEKLQALADSIDSEAAKLSEALQANTPGK